MATIKSIEEKAKAYDKAIEKARIWKDKSGMPKDRQGILDDIFPELKENEDERMKRIISDILLVDNDEIRKILDANKVLIQDVHTWLEKQGKQNNDEDSNILQRFSFYSYKDEPNILYLSGLYVNEEYRNKGIGTKILEVADEVAKSLNCNTIRLKTKKDSNAERLYRIHGYNSLATEESDEIWLEKQGEQKPAWSEEDEVKINRIVACLENLNVADNDILLKDINWLKSLRHQSTWKPSDEQMDTLKSACGGNYVKLGILESLYVDLKKLRKE